MPYIAGKFGSNPREQLILHNIFYAWRKSLEVSISETDSVEMKRRVSGYFLLVPNARTPRSMFIKAKIAP